MTNEMARDQEIKGLVKTKLKHPKDLGGIKSKLQSKCETQAVPASDGEDNNKNGTSCTWSGTSTQKVVIPNFF